MKEIYILTDKYPKEAIPSNIAEGKSRGSRKDYRHFIILAYSSASELETQLIISKILPKMEILDYEGVESLLEEILKMLKTMIIKLKT